VLYLVNAAESPEDAGYVLQELEILSWLGRPTLVLLNQVGAGDLAHTLEGEWRGFLQRREEVVDVVVLDAFVRTWVQENRLVDRIVELFAEPARAVMARLAEAWKRRNRDVFERSIRLLSEDLARTATDREPLPSAFAGADTKRAAMEALGRRLQAAEPSLWQAVIAAHGLEGEIASALRDRLESFRFQGQELLTPKKGAVLGSVISGAVGGLAADLLAGGLSFGGGLLAGTILGALGGAGLSQASRLLRTGEKPAVTWSPEFLDSLVVQHVLRYLAVAHFGRGRGRFEESEEVARLEAAVRRVVAARSDAFAAAWRRAEKEPAAAVASTLAPTLEALAGELLVRDPR